MPNHSQPIPTPPISLSDYESICRVVYSVLKNEKGDLTQSCFHINFCAAAILHEHYHLKAIPRVGAAGYCTNGKPLTSIGFFDVKDGKYDFSGENEHCWLQAGDWHIDFMAPLFAEISQKNKLPSCGKKMFMKLSSQAKNGPNDLLKEGDFFAFGNQQRTLAIVEALGSKPSNEDLMEICTRWFKKPPNKMKPKIGIGNGKGEVSIVPLLQIGITGNW